MDENPNGGRVETKTTSDPRVVKMFRRLERFLDQELPGNQHAITFSNAETGRVFAVFMTPEAYENLMEYARKLAAALEERQELLRDAEEQIEIMADENTLLAIIDAQNEVLQSRVNPPGMISISEEEYEDLKARMLGPDPRRGSWEFTGNDVAGDAGQFVSAQEYQELLNLREKRTRDHKQLSSMDVKLKEYRKSINTLQSSRDSWHAKADQFAGLALLYLNLCRKDRGLPPKEALPPDALWPREDADQVRIAFTSDAIRD